MLYTFRAKNGDTIERDFPMKSAPELGAPIKFKGRNYYRILSLPASVGLAEYDENAYPRVSRALPRYLAGCDHDKNGRPVILNKAHEKRVLAETGYTREYSTHGDDLPPVASGLPLPKMPYER